MYFVPSDKYIIPQNHPFVKNYFLDAIRLKIRKEEQVHFSLVEYFDYNLARPQVYQRSVQVVVALPLAAESVKPLIELFERRSLQVGAGGVDLAEGVDKERVVVTVVGVDVCNFHDASYVCGRSQPYFYDTIIPQKRQKVK